MATTAMSRNESPLLETQKLNTCLWFDGNAEEAANFYVSVFKNSKILNTIRYTDVGPGPKGSVVLIEFSLNGQLFSALNGGPEFKFTNAISQVIHCKNEEEVDYFWDKLSEGGQTIECGWLTDKFGLAWQVVPEYMFEVLRSGDEAKRDRAMRAMMQMKKFDEAELRAAAEGTN